MFMKCFMGKIIGKWEINSSALYHDQNWFSHQSKKTFFNEVTFCVHKYKSIGQAIVILGR